MSKAARRLRIVAAAIVLFLALRVFLDEQSFFPQAGTAFLQAAATGMGVALGVAAVFILLTFLFGRFYCAALCPLGILQDMVGGVLRLKCAPQRNLKTLRYALLAVTVGFVVSGWALPAKWLEPFSMFGRIAGGFLLPLAAWAGRGMGMSPLSGNFPISAAAILSGAAALLALGALVAWENRIYCTAICPVGTLLGLFAKHGVFRMSLVESNCVRCGQCARVCPAGCIDVNAGTLDNERCVRCLNCISVCPKHSIVWTRILPRNGKTSTRTRAEPGKTSRRGFLVGVAGTVLVSSGLARTLKPGGAARGSSAPAIYPPGAGSGQRFASKCTTCLLCVTQCRGNVLQPPDAAFSSVHLDYAKGMCEFNCRACLARCPTGAIRPIPLDQKKRCRIGMAVFHSSRCIAVVDGIHCGACAEHCPTGALRMVQHEGDPCPTPELEEALCIGCGNCSYPCPVRPRRAITIAAVPIQTEADDPEKHFTAPAPPPASSTDEWLL